MVGCRVQRIVTVMLSCAVLAGCGDPLEKVDKLSSVDLVQDAPLVEALPAETEVANQGGFMSRLMRKRTVQAAAAVQNDTVVSEATEINALAETGAVALAAADETLPEKRGLFGLKRKPAQTSAAAAASLVAATDVVALDQSAPKKGLFGLGRKTRSVPPAPSTLTASLGLADAALVQAAKPPTKKRSSGLLGMGKKRAHKGPDTQIVPAGTRLPFGTVARVCDKPGSLGKQIEKFPARGKGYKIYDTNPGSASARPFYVTGFDDGCARTFTAAMAIFGSPTMHEQLRYGLPSSVQPYSLTDKAYEGIKSAVCRVGKKKPCGGKIGLLEKDTTFISLYERFGGNSTWSNILLHKGWVLAQDVKKG